jgi:hypothetical protein
MGVNFNELLEPYRVEEPNLTVEAQLVWLRKKGIPSDYINQAITEFYYEISQGMKYPTTDDLNQALLARAKKIHGDELRETIARMEQRLERVTNKGRGYWRKLWLALWGRL